jgi:hypothetical protein
MFLQPGQMADSARDVWAADWRAAHQAVEWVNHWCSLQGGSIVLATDNSTESRAEGSYVPYGWQQDTYSFQTTWFNFDLVQRNTE